MRVASWYWLMMATVFVATAENWVADGRWAHAALSLTGGAVCLFLFRHFDRREP